MTQLAAGVASRMLRPVLAGLVAAGADAQEALTRAGVEAASIADPDARVPHAQALALWELATQLTGDPDFGLRAAQATDFSMLDVQAHAIFSSSTLRAGIDSATRYQRLQHDAAELTLTVGQQEGVMQHRLPGGRGLPRQPAEFMAATWVLIAREGTGVPVVPRWVHLPHPAPDSVAHHQALFGVMPEFGTGELSACFAREDLERPMVKADPALRTVLDRYAQELLERLPRVHSVAEQVRALVARELSHGNPTLEHAAGLLNMSSRTLERRLRDEGTRHRDIVEELRRELSKTYLADRALSLGEVAFLLGFSEPSAFHRAFKRWTGQTPTAYRAAQ